jgi:hypothetical protein
MWAILLGPDVRDQVSSQWVFEMGKGRFSGWALAVAISAVAAQGISQEDEGPILRPRQKPKHLAGATLLVVCDLACNWRLDGEAKGQIDAGSSAKTRVEIGQHLVIATTADGVDQVKQLSEVKGNGQTVANMELKPVRDARFKTERETRDRVAREQQEKKQNEQDAMTWTDPATRLMWTKSDGGIELNWSEASAYCKTLQWASYSDWRLPSIDELQGIYDPDATVNHAGYVWRVKGGLLLSGGQWSRSAGAVEGEEWCFRFDGGWKISAKIVNGRGASALCVRQNVD